MNFFVVIDTNVLVSAALKSQSNPGVVYKFVTNGVITPLINEKILKEYRDVLSRKKFHLPQDVIDDILEKITRNAIVIDENHIGIELPDEKDRVFYEVTMTSKEERESMLVTGNMKHFPVEPFIVTPKELCEIIIKKICDA